jgi:hypothetical protein
MPPPARRPGSSGRPDRFYLDIAVRYLEAVSGRHPVEDVAAQLGMERRYIRDLLHEARRRGLLTKPPRGRAGGRLTGKAEKLLDRERAASPAARPAE